jgi:hypothetical protein
VLQTARVVESYVFRRSVCGIPTNSMNKTFATFGLALKKDQVLRRIQAHFFMLPSYRRFPSDDEFRREIQTRDLYNFRSQSYWLRRMVGRAVATGTRHRPPAVGRRQGENRPRSTSPLMPVKHRTGCSYFDGPPIVSCWDFCVKEGKLTEPVGPV